MRVFMPVVVVLLAVALGACVDKTVMKEHAVIEVPDGKETKSINLGKMVVKVPRGQVIGQLKAGFACFVVGQKTWRGGSRGAGDSEFSSIFFEELKRNNYNVVGDPTDLFGSKSPAAEISVGGLITSIASDVCYPNANAYFMDKMNGRSKASISVEWQVYSNMDKKVIFKTASTGEAERNFSDGNADEVMYLAFTSAVQGLLADKQFLDAVMDAGKGSGNMGGLTDATQANPPAAQAGDATGPITVAAQAKQTRTLAEVQKSVVVLELGGHGSGVLIGDEGYILTNHHVVDGVKRMRVLFSNGTKAEGVVVKSEPKQDVGLLKIESPPVKGLPLRLEDLAPGTEVYAVGAPLDTANRGTITKGVVSSYRFKKDGSRWLQSDTSVTFGNSGGPMVDAQGRVVGLTSWGSGEYKGLSYFVPIADGLRALDIQTR
ncbi:S1C family serine protease [Fundidesulfovibrio terrae]|uniref:S1C family serine protease n=1 Tax=Fundidesulfovibrio terrae TaxID=2922866 RepID=UPI001FAFCCB1|nr:S1C family serine protease [Fundidesulfovibrio terrae]